MVIFDLVCNGGHYFEGWFKNAEDLDEQKSAGLLTCPFCDSSDVNKKLAVPKVGRKSNSSASTALESVVAESNNADPQMALGRAKSPEAYAQLQKMLGKVHDYIDQNFEDVGNRFADEALSIHRGEKEAVNIKGTASKEDLQELAEEGVTALPLPPKPINKKKLN